MGFAHWNVPYILFAPQRDAANRRRDAPPIFFLRHQKENAPCTVEKKKCLFQPCTYVQGWGNGFCENCCAGEELRTKSRAGCRACPALYAVLIVASNLKVQIGHPLLLFPLPLPLILRGVSKGESTKAPPGADKARCFRGNGTIGGPSGPGIV